jgi:hypothetical protein
MPAQRSEALRCVAGQAGGRDGSATMRKSKEVAVVDDDATRARLQ